MVGGFSFELQSAHDKWSAGPRGNTMGCPFNSASMLGPPAVPGSVKLSDGPKITGKDCRTMSLMTV